MSRISLFKRSKTSWGMGRSKQIIHGCTMLISGLKGWIIAVFARTMLRWSTGHNLADLVVTGALAIQTRQNSHSQLTQPAYSVRGMCCLNPLGYVCSKFHAEILISLASVHLLWKFSSPSVASHWFAINTAVKRLSVREELRGDHSRPQSPSFLGHVFGGYKLSRVALGTRMSGDRYVPFGNATHMWLCLLVGKNR